jgi:hypothetical protein
MKHLSRSEFVDLIESSPSLPPDRVRHLEVCERCRAEAETLRVVMAMTQTDEGSEPSPLFWDHFAARVAEAVRTEPPVTDAHASLRWLRTPLASWAAASAVAVLVVIAVAWRVTLHAPAPARQAQVSARAASPSAPVAPGGDDVDADEAWAVVRAAAIDLRWEDAHAAGLTAQPGAVEDIALELTGDERAELARLLDEEAKHTGA